MHHCDLTVIAPAAAGYHWPHDVLAGKAGAAFGGPTPERYDLLSYPRLGSDVIGLLAEDVAIAVKLHGAEKVLIAAEDLDTAKAIENGLRGTQGLGELRFAAVELPRIAHASDAPTVITCMDFRLHGADGVSGLLRRTYGELGDEFDVFTVPGVGKDLTTGEGDRFSGVASQLEGSAGPVLLLAHEDCGKYGGSGGFSDHDGEFSRYEGDLHTAAEVLAGRTKSKGGAPIRIECGIIELKDDRPTGIRRLGK